MNGVSGFDPSEKFVGQVCINTQSDLIEITEDKLENILIKHLKYLSLKKSFIKRSHS